LAVICGSEQNGIEVHRLSADYRYWPFDNRHRPIIGIGR